MTDLRTYISRYVNSTRRLPEILESGETFSPADGSRKMFSVVPMSMAQLTSMLPGGKAVLSGIFPDMKTEMHSGIEMCDPASMKGEKDSKDTIPEEMTVEDLTKLAVYSIAESLGAAGNGAGRVDEVVFQLKNDAGIPDDFMPQSMMDMVEGRPLVDPGSLLSGLQPSFSSGIVFPLFRIAGQDVLSVGFLCSYPDAFINPDRLNGINLTKAVRDEFVSFMRSPVYDEFVAGRTLRSVVFTMEKKKSRIIGKPLFDEAKIRSLLKIGVVAEVNGIYSVPDKYSIQDVKKLASDYEAKNHIIASEWKHRKIRLGN